MNNLRRFLLGFFLMLGRFFYAQEEIDLENIGKRTIETLKRNPFKISGSVSANTVFYGSNANDSREHFTYFLNGNLNLGIYNWSMPISYSFTNQGSQLNYQVPFKFNRFSITPKYKWIKVYLGDAGMSFSPYTYNGLLFTGGGVELTPEFPLKVSLMTGKLNKAIEDDDNPATIPSYKRMGYGTKIEWEKERYKLGFIGFYAKDDVGSLKNNTESKGVLSQENMVFSLQGSMKVYNNLEIFAEVANSALTEDLRYPKGTSHKGIAASFIKSNATTTNNFAYNFGTNFTLKKGMLGIRYERVDPEYKTLGAYYFNNDFENITLNTAFNLLKDKLSLQTNIGRQRDNLQNQKGKQTSRWVGTVNANFQAFDKLMITASYSNFTMFTNNQLNQFNNINNNPLQIQQPRDSIQYRQISQNVNININYALSATKEKAQNININYSLNDMVNKENGIVRRGGISRFHNANINYNISFPERKMNIAASINYTNTYAASQYTNIIGPSISFNKGILKDKMQLSSGASYNISSGRGIRTSVFNFRAGTSYAPWKKHNFDLNIINMFRLTNQNIPHPKMNEITCTVGYNYRF